MKRIIATVLIIIAVISLMVVAFTINQVGVEEQRLKADLQNRSILIAESLKETVESNFVNKSDQYLQNIVEKFDNRERLVGLAIYDNKGSIVAVSSGLPEEISQSQKISGDAMYKDKINGDFVQFKDERVYLLAIPLHDDKSVVGSLMIVQNAGHINDRLNEIWQGNLIRLVIQASLLSLAIILLVRWIIYEPIRGLVETLKLTRMGNIKGEFSRFSNNFFFKPLVNEISNIRKSLIDARMSASEEARMRLEKLDSPWTAQRLKEFIKDALKGRTIFMVSNREPYIHTKNGGKISYFFPASGVVTAIESVMQACGGMWIAHGSGDADKLTVDKEDKLQVPPDEPKYTLRRVWLTEEEELGYYYGFSNEGLWPLCHIAHQRPTFRKEDWEEYKKVNSKFAQVVLSEIKHFPRPVVLIQDFHLALLPRIVKNVRPDITVGIFWHTPWPNAESFSICPWKKEILDGILGADLIGFQTQLHCNNFIETVGKELESLIDFERFAITRNTHTSYIKRFPISIAFPNGYNESQSRTDNFNTKQMLNSLGIRTNYIGLGVDRLDYTKGILERLKAIEIFLKKYPSYLNNFTFIQIAAPTRSKIKKFREFAENIEKEVERVNSLFKNKNWKPVVLIKRHHDREEVNRFYKLANVCLVTSLHDGMNLVAKEYVVSRNDEKGVLILSQFTGASRELKDALIINPYNGEQTAEALKTALELPLSEQTKRMRKMREVVKNRNIYRWSAELLRTIVELE